MNTLRKRIEDELNGLDPTSLVAVYEYLRAIKAIRPAPGGGAEGEGAPSIEEVRRQTSTSSSDWSEAVRGDRDERI
ncbi:MULTISPECIES: hypothetical protein [Deferrisoma]